MSQRRTLLVSIAGASDRFCGSCMAQDADEHLMYCGVFRKALNPAPVSAAEDGGPAGNYRLTECCTAEQHATIATDHTAKPLPIGGAT